MLSPEELMLHVDADVDISDIENILQIKSETVNDYYDYIGTATVGQIMLSFRKPFWTSTNMGNTKPFKFRVTFECGYNWMRSREILVMQLCKELYLKFWGYYLVTRDDSPIGFWLGDAGFFLNEADRNYYDMFPHDFSNSIFVDAPFTN